MKKNLLISAFALFFSVGEAFAQDIPQRQVPETVVNSFKQAFPKARDIDWEMDGDMYKVEFKTGVRNDHDVWFDKAGEQTRHEEEVSEKELPNAVTSKIKSEFTGYRVDDVKKITQGKVTYTLEVKKLKEEWKLVLDADGNVVSKIAD